MCRKPQKVEIYLPHPQRKAGAPGEHRGRGANPGRGGREGRRERGAWREGLQDPRERDGCSTVTCCREVPKSPRSMQGTWQKPQPHGLKEGQGLRGWAPHFECALFFFKNPDQEKKEVESCLEEEKESRKGEALPC